MLDFAMMGSWLDLMILEDFQPTQFYDSITYSSVSTCSEKLCNCNLDQRSCIHLILYLVTNRVCCHTAI